MSSARKNIVDVVASKDHFEKLKEDTIISLAKWKPKQDEGTDTNEVVETKSLEPVKTESITKWSKTIETEEDVEEYLENIRKDLVKYIKEGKKVKLI
ncbi:hypothetical protein H6762_03305 [Candidatus Nomurabacteria bacterium]|nr:hypothetical protein [Candidatus Nomurabacteria bacterium]